MSAPVSAPAAIEYPEKIDGAVLKVAGVVVLGAIMSILDITVVNVALPTFQKVFAPEGGEPLAYSTVAWTVTAYTLALATVIPLTGWAGSSATGIDVMIADRWTVPPLVEASESGEAFWFGLHGILTKLLMALIALHVLGAVKRQFDGDGTLTRMIRGKA